MLLPSDWVAGCPFWSARAFISVGSHEDEKPSQTDEFNPHPLLDICKTCPTRVVMTAVGPVPTQPVTVSCSAGVTCGHLRSVVTRRGQRLLYCDRFRLPVILNCGQSLRGRGVR
ncbi:hypothetical protein ElyMa_000558200 [Elysia marginata]|uniref:Uncharacterized protein n=1 Tax=Elysia marginata TaxID=1093978 RepID=A0AAV4G237_9GAST|nr:hypothetical protein ElyMa_000558200 [Elysia marginata]